MSRTPGRSAAALAGALLAGACNAERPLTTHCRLAPIHQAAVSPGVGNVLSAVVTADISDADSVAIRYGLADGPLDRVTPAVRERTGGAYALPIFGLLPATRYVARVVTYTGCMTVKDPELVFTTGTLPADLPVYTASGTTQQMDYTVFAAGPYGLVIDNAGRVVWYHRFPNGPGLNFQAQPNGRYVARPNVPADSTAVWIEVDPLGNVTRRLACARGMSSRPHDMIAAADGSWWLMCDEVRTVDLSAQGASSNARVTGTAVQHVAADGRVLFEWSPFDHMAVDLSRLDAADRAGTINWTHGNSIDLDAEGNLYVSFRNLSEIVKIDVGTGAIRWRLGGANSQLQLDDPSPNPFARQHGLRVTGPGQIVLLDNLGDPASSSAKRYEIDESRQTARLSSIYAPSAAVIARIGGSTESLPGGRTLVSYGNGGRVEEYGAAGNVVWRLEGNPGYVFRAQRIASLYRPTAPRIGAAAAP